MVALVGGVVVAAIALFVSLLAFHTADAESLRRAGIEHRRAEVDLVETRLAVETMALDLGTARLLEAVDGQTLLFPALDVTRVGADLDRLAARRGPVGDDAAAVSELLDLAGSGDLNLAEVLALADAVSVTGRPRVGDPVVDELRSGGDRVALASRLAHGGIAVHAAVGAGVEDLGVDPQQLVASAVDAPSAIAGRDAIAVTPLLEELDDVLEAHGQPALHRQLREVSEGERFTLESSATDLAASAAEVQVELRSVLDESSAGIRTALDEEDRASDLRGARFRIAGWVLIALAIMAVATGIAVALVGRREVRTPIRLVDVDESTGMITPSTMRRLSTRHLLDRRFSQHVVGIIRIARIEMIADAYGVAAAQRVESVIARRLQAAAVWLAGGRADVAAVLTRRARGEFVMTLHAARHIDVDLVRRVVLLRSGTAFPLGEDHVPVGYGVGLHLEIGTADLDEALDAAERAILEHPIGRDLAPRPVSTPLELVRSH